MQDYVPLFVGIYFIPLREQLRVRMYISEVHECGSIDLRVSHRVANPEFAPSVPAISGAHPEFSI
jgi:hypothetical protein